MAFWEQRKVLVSGGAGFLGLNLVAKLVELGADVRVVDSLDRSQGVRTGGESWEDEVSFEQLNLLDEEACQRACQGREIVFHCAARAGAIGYYDRHPGRVLTDNLLLDVHVLRGALAAGVSAYFYPSSSMVYPAEKQSRPDAPSLKEEDAFPANPPNSYGWAKLTGEMTVRHAVGEHKGFAAAVLRIENVFGPGQDIDLERGSVIPVLVRRALEYPRVPFTLKGTGEETRCYCYVDDVVTAILRAVEAAERKRLVGPLNITGAERVRIIDLAHQIGRLSEKDLQPTLEPADTRIWGQVLDCSRARAELTWEPCVSLEEGLRRTFGYVESRLRVSSSLT